jgi:hypothetical protein
VRNILTNGSPFKFKDYLELVDWTGRVIRDEQLPSGYKRGHIDQVQPNILNRLNLKVDAWKVLRTEFESHFQCWVGNEHDEYAKVEGINGGPRRVGMNAFLIHPNT